MGGEAGGATHAQVELNKKREAEVAKLRKDLEEAHILQESTLMSLKKKHQDAVAEMSEQIDQLSKMKAKVEKDKSGINHEIQDVRTATDEIVRSKASAEKSNKNLLASLNEVNKKVEEANLTLGDFENNKRKIAAENGDLLRQLQELENQANMLVKFKSQLVSQLDEARKVSDDEARERTTLLGKYKNLEHEIDGMKEQLNAKLGQLEKAKAKIQIEIDEMAAQADQAHILNSSMEKKAKQFDRVVGEWKQKVESLSLDLDVAQKECRNASSELFRVKNAYEESILQLDEVRKENKTLSNEIKDIMDQISEGGRSIHEIDKIRKRLEAEKMEL